MSFGVILPNHVSIAGPEGFRTIATRAEELGFDHVWLGDHVVMPSQADSDYPDTETRASPFDPEQACPGPLGYYGLPGWLYDTHQAGHFCAHSAATRAPFHGQDHFDCGLHVGRAFPPWCRGRLARGRVPGHGGRYLQRAREGDRRIPKDL